MSGQNVVAIGSAYRALSPAEIARAVHGFRKRLNLNQTALAKRAGVTEQTIQRIERAERIDDETLKHLAKALFAEEHVFVGLCYIPSQEKAFEDALGFLDEHSVVDVHRIISPEDIKAFLDAQGWIVDGSDVSGEARKLVAVLQETLVDWGDVYSELPATEQLDACYDFFHQVQRIERTACVAKYGAYHLVVANNPGRLGILKFWARGDPRARLSQIMLSKQEIRLW
jgi:transcriptional regulator with XRE-family HTH domain